MQGVTEALAKGAQVVGTALGLQPVNSAIDSPSVKKLRQTFEADPQTANMSYLIHSTVDNNFKITNSVARFALGVKEHQHLKTQTITCDQPMLFGGTDMGPDPEEIGLSGLASNLLHAFLVLCAVEGISLSKCSITTKASFDVRSLLDDRLNVPRGFEAICTEFDVAAEGVTRDQLYNLIRRTENMAPLAQTMAKGCKLCVCLKGYAEKGKVEEEVNFATPMSSTEKHSGGKSSLGVENPATTHQ